MERNTSTIGEMKAVQLFNTSFISGFIAGAVAKFCGHPLDTVKTRIQVSGSRLGLNQQFTHIWQTEGLGGLYKGVTSPVLGNAPMLAMFFATNHMAKEAMTTVSNDTKEFVAGCAAGASILLFTLPIEVLKVQMQGRQDRNIRYWDIIKKVYLKHGVRGLYRGFGISFWLWVPQSGLYFYNYHKFQQIFHKFFNNSPSSRKNELVGKIFAGGFAGQIGWLLSYPFDWVKTFIQYNPEHRSFSKAFKYLKRTHGMSYFYRGCTIAMLRAFPVSAITLCVYDYVHHFLKMRSVITT